MGVGKYSPTVSAWYRTDKDWHRKSCATMGENGWLDTEGYDSYGYHDVTDRDRAGYYEYDYLHGEWQEDEYVYPLAERIYEEWRDKPIPRKEGE